MEWPIIDFLVIIVKTVTFEQETEDVIKLDLLSEWIPQCVDLTASAREVMGLVEGEGGNGVGWGRG